MERSIRGARYLERRCCNHSRADKNPLRRVTSLLRRHAAHAAHYAVIAKRRQGDSPSFVGALEL
eukprot:6492426-Pyramimonas_sp.AAC.1